MIFVPTCLREDHAVAMIPDETAPPDSELEAACPLLKSANDNGSTAAAPIDPRILTIARAIGRQIAREQMDALQAANDDRSEDER